MMENNVQYNPFGNRANQFIVSDMEDGHGNGGSWFSRLSMTKKGFSIFASVLVLMLVAIFVANYIFIDGAKGDAKDSMEAMNTTNEDVYNALMASDIKGRLNNFVQEKGADNQSDSLHATRAVEYIEAPEKSGRRFLEVINEDDSNEKSAVKLVYLFSLCDEISAMQDPEFFAEKARCDEVTNAAQEYGANVQKYNSLSSSVSGIISFNRGKFLPDFTSQTGK